MYGNKHEDPVVRYYDFSLAKGQTEEMPYYLNKVIKSGGPILDIACGTGRLSLEFARAGYKVTSVDNSEGMLEVFKEKLEVETENVKKQIEIMKAPFNNFKLPKKYKTIICCDAFFHNLSVEDEKNCLNCVREHMQDDAIFIFNIPNPNPKYLLWATSDESSSYSTRGEYKMPNSQNKLLIEQALDADLLSQMIETKLRYTVKDKGDSIIEQSISNWKTRYLFQYEAIHLLEICGFKILSIEGNYKGEPIDINSQLIFTVTKAR